MKVKAYRFVLKMTHSLKHMHNNYLTMTKLGIFLVFGRTHSSHYVQSRNWLNCCRYCSAIVSFGLPYNTPYTSAVAVTEPLWSSIALLKRIKAVRCIKNVKSRDKWGQTISTKNDLVLFERHKRNYSQRNFSWRRKKLKSRSNKRPLSIRIN